MVGGLNTGTLVVVADGERAKLFVNDGNKRDVDLRHVVTLTPQALEDDGPAGKRPPDQSLQDIDEATFAKQLSQALYQRLHKDPYDALVLVADPQTLGQMRPLLHAEVVSRTVAEVPKTLTNAPLSEIKKVLELDDA